MMVRKMHRLADVVQRIFDPLCNSHAAQISRQENETGAVIGARSCIPWESGSTAIRTSP